MKPILTKALLLLGSDLEDKYYYVAEEEKAEKFVNDNGLDWEDPCQIIGEAYDQSLIGNDYLPGEEKEETGEEIFYSFDSIVETMKYVQENNYEISEEIEYVSY